uniref:Aldehyde dehydrogenase domain-containing protein n=1 Tax=Panagrolaimus sp. JU765 TaxID=591449 RepID=A0AC34RQ30_9BILA
MAGLVGSLVFFLKNKNPLELNATFEEAVRSASKIDTRYFHVGILDDAGCLIHATVTSGVVRHPIQQAIDGLKPDALEFCDVQVDDSVRKQAIKFASDNIGAAYNDVFSPDFVNSVGEKAFYCCQLAAHAYGRHLFDDHYMNFLDKEGNFIDYWVKYFQNKKRPIPEGQPGTHPSILRYSKCIRFRGRQEITMKSFSIPKNLTEALHFIGGKRINLAKENPVFEVVEPRSGKLLAKIEEATRSDVQFAVEAARKAQEDDVQFAVEAARKAQEEWSNWTKDERSRVLKKAAHLIRKNVNEISWWESVDNGKPIYEAKLDILSCADTFEHYSSIDLNGEHIPLSDRDSRFAYIRREPLGVVGAIGAWNYPMQTASWKIAPAIACGNGIVYKPSPLAPISSVILAQLLQHSGVPDGLVNVVQGGGKTGSAICQTRDVKKVSFTGSVATGRIIAQNAAADFVKPVTLELGGKSSCIIFDDCGVDMAVAGAMMANFFSQGAVCSNASKVLVHKNILNEFVESLVEKTKQLKIGDPLKEDTRVGACISKDHLDKVKSYIDGAVKE